MPDRNLEGKMDEKSDDLGICIIPFENKLPLTHFIGIQNSGPALTVMTSP